MLSSSEVIESPSEDFREEKKSLGLKWRFQRSSDVHSILQSPIQHPPEIFQVQRMYCFPVQPPSSGQSCTSSRLVFSLGCQLVSWDSTYWSSFLSVTGGERRPDLWEIHLAKDSCCTSSPAVFSQASFSWTSSTISSLRGIPTHFLWTLILELMFCLLNSLGCGWSWAGSNV